MPTPQRQRPARQCGAERRGVERIAVATNRLLSTAALLSPTCRRDACRSLAAASPVFREWVRWTRWFPVLFTVGVLAQFGALLAFAAGLPPVVSYALVLAGLLPLAVLAIRQWHTNWQALDIAAAHLARMSDQS